MRPLILAGAMAALAVATTEAAAQGAWCAEDMNARNCGFYTQAQCQAAASGNGAFCMPNPFAPGAAIAESPKRGRRAGQNR
jgi:Protein of unknown function (DUF3551)